jgi:hypothetical protein
MLDVEFDSAFLSHEVLRLAATWPGSFLKEPLGLVSLAARASSIQISPLGEVARDSFSEENGPLGLQVSLKDQNRKYCNQRDDESFFHR